MYSVLLLFLEAILGSLIGLCIFTAGAYIFGDWATRDVIRYYMPFMAPKYPQHHPDE